MRLGLDPMERHVEELLRENAQLRARLLEQGVEAPVRFCDARGCSHDGRGRPYCMLEEGHDGICRWTFDPGPCL